MSRAILYHGSERIIDCPVYGFGRADNDYGQGFYCTEKPELAREWAAATERGGFLNVYQLAFAGLVTKDLTAEPYHPLHWLATLLANRKVRLSSPIERRAQDYLLKYYLPDFQGVDIIRGYRADDSYFSFARSFLSNTITLEQLSYALRLGELGEQVVLISEKAFSALAFQRSEPVDGAVFFLKRRERDMRARELYQRELERDVLTGKRIADIMEEKWDGDLWRV